MGIRGLHTCLLKSAPDVFTAMDWAGAKGRRIGIDIQCFLYRALSNHLDPIELIRSQIQAFTGLEIAPIYVFDGPPPPEKELVTLRRRDERRQAAAKIAELRSRLPNVSIEEREQIETEIRLLEAAYPQLTYEMKDAIKQIFETCGVDYVNSACEADTVLAHLFRREVIDYVASFDLDFLARGVKLLIPNQITTPPGQTWTMLDPSTISATLGLSGSQFLDLCVLMGSDYTPTLPIVPWSLALRGLQQQMRMDEIWSRHTFSNWRRGGVEQKTVSEIGILRDARDILSGLHDRPDNMIESIQWFSNAQHLAERV